MNTFSRRYRNYLLVLLTAIMIFNYVDRLALGLLLQDIKVDLKLTDTQLGLLTGIAFALFYATMGIPIARWADRGNRVRIISLTVVVWSAAVALCAAARNFTQLLFIRIGVAVGEAGCHPPAFSLIADYFTRVERPRAISRYMLGWPMALVIGYFGAGWLNELFGWRVTFVLIGIPGLVFGALAALTLKDPRFLNDAGGKTIVREDSATTVDAPRLKEVLLKLWSTVTFRRLLICMSLSYFFGNGILQWQPAFFVRSHGLKTGELGTWFAVIYGFGGLLGTYIGGELASRYAAGNERLQLRAMTVIFSVIAVISAAVYLPADRYWALAALTVCGIVGATMNGPIFAATQTLVPPHMRATSVAVALFFCNLIGLGLGPLAVGKISDMLRPWAGEESLRYALLIMCPGYFWAAWYTWRASKTVTADVEAIRAGGDE